MSVTRDRPLAITGVGLVSPAGLGVPAFAAALAAGTRHVGPLEAAVARGLPATEGGALPASLGPRAGRLREAARAALAEASRGVPRSAGLALGTALGETGDGERLRTEPAELDVCGPFGLTAALAAGAGLRGPQRTVSVTCLSGLYAVEQAALALAAGRAEAMLCGGLDGLGRLMQAGFAALGALAGDAPTARDGMRLGEAAAFVALEPAGAAGTRALARITGQGLHADGTHLTSPDLRGVGMACAIRQALERAGRAPAEVAGVSLSAAASPAYQTLYAAALAEVWGARPPATVGWETATGHLLAATGIVGLIHATLPARWPAQAGVRLALTVGFGGQNGATVVER